MNKIIVYIDWEDNYGAYSKKVQGCVATAMTLEGVKKAYASALKFHLKGMKEDNDSIPAFLKKAYTLEFKLTTIARLKSLDGYVSRAAIARASGINQRLLGHYFSGEKWPREKQLLKIKSGIKKISNQISKIAAYD